ncbi:aldo/keto reductase [Jatrophihabitans sp.]|uniref:aldo/keto reductase n=1 Tax=Jatrophihabitans sp. TaxID=1932789 RepID=UPI0030C7662D|nr:oxidoreductase [Jatrophihabitans sp.]
MTDQTTVTLPSGHSMPQLGFGVFQVPLDETERAVTAALNAGYRSIDTAAMYRNEAGVAAALAKSGLAREEVFVTTKLANPAHGYDAALTAFETSRKLLDVDYVDLYLIHWPLPARDLYLDTWRAFVTLQEQGVVRDIGVSNFQPAHLERIMDETGVIPAVNQIELHPYLTQQALQDFDRSRGIHTEAWSPIGRGGELLGDPVITSLAEKYGKTPAQIVIRWHLELGNIVIPKSVTPTRIVENLDVFDIDLDGEDVLAISELNRDTRLGPDPDHFNPS